MGDNEVSSIGDIEFDDVEFKNSSLTRGATKL